MFEHYVIPTRRRTPEDVLATLNELQRQMHQNQPYLYTPVAFSRSTSLREWLDAAFVCNTWQWQTDLNRLFNVRLSLLTWNSPLLSERKRSLGELCDAIAAAGSFAEVVEPIHIFGRPCVAAGIFAALVAKLRQHHIATEGLTPSSALTPWLIHAGGLFQDLSFTRPGRLSRIRGRQSPIQQLFDWLQAMIWIATAFCLLATFVFPLAGPLALILGLAGGLLRQLVPRLRLRHQFIELEGLTTIGDYCRQLAGPAKTVPSADKP